MTDDETPASGKPRSLRAAQKIATRRRLLAAARSLMAKGETVTLAAAAEVAGLSVATAYRYYSDPETMRLDAGLEFDPGVDGEFLQQFEATTAGVTDVAERVVVARRLLIDRVRSNLALYRLFVAKGHENVVRTQTPEESASRDQRRIPLIERALSPVLSALGSDRARALVLSLVGVVGPEAEFVLRDVGRLPDAEIDMVNDQVLRDIVTAHLLRAGVPPKV